MEQTAIATLGIGKLLFLRLIHPDPSSNFNVQLLALGELRFRGSQEVKLALRGFAEPNSTRVSKRLLVTFGARKMQLMGGIAGG